MVQESFKGLKKLGHKTLCSKELKLSNIFWWKKITKKSPTNLGQKKKNMVKNEAKIFLAPRKNCQKTYFEPRIFSIKKMLGPKKNLAQKICRSLDNKIALKNFGSRINILGVKKCWHRKYLILREETPSIFEGICKEVTQNKLQKLIWVRKFDTPPN